LVARKASLPAQQVGITSCANELPSKNVKFGAIFCLVANVETYQWQQFSKISVSPGA
jgi:hypothetical protein